MKARPDGSTESLFAELLRAGESVPAIRDILERTEPDDSLLLEVLHRAVPVRLLEFLGTTSPWSTRGRVLGGIVLNPRSSRALALRLLPGLFWRDLAEVARTLRLDAGIRVRAEGLLKDMVLELRLGERITLARLATPPLLALLLGDLDGRVIDAALANPRLREEDLLVALRQDAAPRALLEGVAASRRWTEFYAIRLALVLQKRTPLALALAQLSSLVEKDLKRIAATPDLTPLLQVAALRVASEPRGKGPAG